MGHTHSFPRESDDVEWNEEEDLLVVKRNCEQTVQENPPGLDFGGPPGRDNREPCSAVQKTTYKIHSVTDNHNNHDLDCSSVVLDDGYVSDTCKHVSELEEKPDWVEHIEDIVRDRAKNNSHIAHMTRLMGKQFSPLIATSDGEYNVTFNKVEEWVEE